MFLLSVVGGIHLGSVIFQLVSLLLLIALVVGITSLIVMFNKKNKRLSKIEEKVDKLLTDKDKNSE
ncbi:hypothetical protein GH741_12760 [Aquibacillus halophilus]|uniref:DUF4083 domain-containing protein n=1 Tax=Aquibacillus halophilus TaxID=930132 RepID=A0A6A8DIG9_9BACI|nr:hypothetical protein [Aquibacillus halophilus]MRH43551.1 hypothetical protein [Aquibacillus halophilus]